MTYTSRLAVIDPDVPTISVTLYGEEYPLVPSTSRRDSDPITGAWCPQWACGRFSPQFYTFDTLNMSNSNHPALFASAYTTDGDQLDYIGVQVYALADGSRKFNVGTRTLSDTLVQPETITFPNVGVETSGVFTGYLPVASAGSTANAPEMLYFFTDDFGSDTYGQLYAGLKYDIGKNASVVGMYDTAGDGTAAAPLAAIADGSVYYIIRQYGTYTFAFTMCSEAVHPATSHTNWAPGFTHADLPASLNTLLDFSSHDISAATYAGVAIHASDVGFVISYKKKITGVWTSKYILVSLDWTTFQFIEFTAGNALAQQIIDQGEGNPYDSGNPSIIDYAKHISAYTKNGIWYLLGGTLDAPVVARDDQETGYGLLKIGSTDIVDEGFFNGSSGWSALLDGAFFGAIDLAFNFPNSGDPDTCTEITLVAQSLSGATAGVECLFRPWTYTLDGHDFFNLRLGCDETIVYDTYSEQWYSYTTGDLDTWRIVTGINWPGGQVLADANGSNILVGDEELGVLYFLDPTKEDDDNPDDAGVTQTAFQRVVQGQLVQVGRDYSPCFGAMLIGSMGDNQDPSNLTDVTLSISDDNGNTYVSCGTVTIPSASYNYRVTWKSLGSIRMPGRLFKIVDYGSMLRIDGLERLYAPES